MVVVLAYYSDGSGKPKVKFFPADSNQLTDVCVYVADEASEARHVEVYEITNVKLPPICIYPNVTEEEEE